MVRRVKSETVLNYIDELNFVFQTQLSLNCLFEIETVFSLGILENIGTVISPKINLKLFTNLKTQHRNLPMCGRNIIKKNRFVIQL